MQHSKRQNLQSLASNKKFPSIEERQKYDIYRQKNQWFRNHWEITQMIEIVNKALKTFIITIIYVQEGTEKIEHVK